MEIPHAKVDLPKIIARLSELNYEGQIRIEREISAPNERASVKREIAYLRKVIES